MSLAALPGQSTAKTSTTTWQASHWLCWREMESVRDHVGPCASEGFCFFSECSPEALDEASIGSESAVSLSAYLQA